MASTMMSGYFLRNAQQQILLEQALPAGKVSQTENKQWEISLFVSTPLSLIPIVNTND
ncbi:DUF760 domain-containing protein [Leptolyngbya sp. 7M]|nr:DUF760 domain-containing protein [Leptolyngbya sp. 7M]